MDYALFAARVQSTSGENSLLIMAIINGFVALICMLVSIVISRKRIKLLNRLEEAIEIAQKAAKIEQSRGYLDAIADTTKFCVDNYSKDETLDKLSPLWTHLQASFDRKFGAVVEQIKKFMERTEK